jgi:2-oxoglutarate dehydrogenase E1 component
MLRTFRKPLIVLTPKSLLRLPAAVSRVHDFSSGAFRHVIDDTTDDPSIVEKLIFCTGKVYYDLVAHRAAIAEPEKTAIVRIEQLHPLPLAQIEAVLDKYASAHTRMWVQEEPLNAGAWHWMADRFRESVGLRLLVVARAASASPAVASTHAHVHEQHQLLVEALGIEAESSPESTNAQGASGK